MTPLCKSACSIGLLTLVSAANVFGQGLGYSYYRDSSAYGYQSQPYSGHYSGYSSYQSPYARSQYYGSSRSYPSESRYGRSDSYRRSDGLRKREHSYPQLHHEYFRYNGVGFGRAYSY